MKKIIAILVSLILAISIAVILPLFLNNSTSLQANIENEISLVQQEIVSYSDKENEYYKLYADGKLIGVINDIDNFYSLIDEEYSLYKNEFPDTTLGLSNSCYLSSEKSYANFEDCDIKIVDYLVDNNLLGVKTNCIEFSTSAGVYEIIYVKSLDDFYYARDEFLLNFISEDSLQKLRNNEQISYPSELGSVDIALTMLEKITISEAIVNPGDIFTNVNQIYDFLCYGRNKERDYYTVKEGDTLNGVGYYFSDMSPKQIVMLNPDVLSSVDQIITPGMQLNVTYYTSPITIQVTTEKLAQEYIAPETPDYVEDDTLEEGVTKILVQEESGIKNVMYKETWINGVLQSGEKQSETIVKQPIKGQIAVGTLVTNVVGTGNFIWPVDNPYITCNWGCYLNHTGTDFINRYETYGPVYAADSGIVEDIGYSAFTMGNYVIINHNNGFRTMYMHLKTTPFVDIGDNIYRGQVLGNIGSTGKSSGPHLHFIVEYNGERYNSCNYLPCDLIK